MNEYEEIMNRETEIFVSHKNMSTVEAIIIILYIIMIKMKILRNGFT